MSLIDLQGKAALVTGGSRGIGAATGIMLAEAGARVAITYRVRKDDADRVLTQIDAAQPQEASRGDARVAPTGIAVRADLSRQEDCERAVAETVQAFGNLDIFVANAGIWPSEEVPIREMDDERWRKTLAVNLDSVFYGCRAALRAMRSDGGKGTVRPSTRPPDRPTRPTRRIVIVSSTAGQRGEAYHADYAATKGAIISFVKSLAVEAAPDVNVNSVAPGWVDTEMSKEPYEREGGQGRKEIERSIPLGRVAAAADIAAPIVFLCSDMARHITGEIVNVNGGAILCG